MFDCVWLRDFVLVKPSLMGNTKPVLCLIIHILTQEVNTSNVYHKLSGVKAGGQESSDMSL